MLDEKIKPASKVCDCGRIITRAEDQARGICRLCNPFSENRFSKGIDNGDWREQQRLDNFLLER